jgi:hypothetical protein
MSYQSFTVPSVFTGRFLKDNPRYGRLIFGYFLGLVSMIFMYVIGVPSLWLFGFFGFMILLAVAAIIISGGKISMTELDERILTIGSAAIQVGNEEFLIRDITALSIYIHSYYNQHFQETWGSGSSYGMDNRIFFKTAGKKFEYRFIIADEKSFVALYWVLDDWNNAGFRYGLKEVYGREYILHLMGKYNR